MRTIRFATRFDFKIVEDIYIAAKDPRVKVINNLNLKVLIRMLWRRKLAQKESVKRWI